MRDKLIKTLKKVTASEYKVTIDLADVAQEILDDYHSAETMLDAFDKVPPLAPNNWYYDLVEIMDYRYDITKKVMDYIRKNKDAK